MTVISLIVVMDKELGIGINNKLLCHLPADLKHFKKITLGKPIIMGYNTYLSIGRPLPGRLNIVLTRQNREIEGVAIAHTMQEALSLTTDYEEVVIIGGEQIYKQSFAIAQRMYISIIDHVFKADAHFVKFDKNKWTCRELGHHEQDKNNGHAITFYQYDLNQ
ncbi:MAG: dihydrofolate reductase [Legionellaceae bacterium]|nr:dihydrofolate reductase [Legionellaceae bacterium]